MTADRLELILDEPAEGNSIIVEQDPDELPRDGWTLLRVTVSDLDDDDCVERLPGACRLTVVVDPAQARTVAAALIAHADAEDAREAGR